MTQRTVEDITLEGDTVTMKVLTIEEVTLGDPGQLPGPPAQSGAGLDALVWSIPTVLRRLDDCPMCDASGKLYGVECPACGGYGLVEESDADFKARCWPSQR